MVAFEDAIAAGELERAIGLYTGPFLDGFHLPGASGFEQWAEESGTVCAARTPAAWRA